MTARTKQKQNQPSEDIFQNPPSGGFFITKLFPHSSVYRVSYIKDIDMRIPFLYGLCTVIFFAIDMVWLGFVARGFYKEKLGFILSDKVNWAAAITFYLIFIGGILFFAVLPALRDHSWQTALLHGAILGGLCYATYDLTNMATISRWPLIIVVVDIIWGIVLTGSVSLLTYLIGIKFS